MERTTRSKLSSLLELRRVAMMGAASKARGRRATGMPWRFGGGVGSQEAGTPRGARRFRPLAGAALGRRPRDASLPASLGRPFALSRAAASAVGNLPPAEKKEEEEDKASRPPAQRLRGVKREVESLLASALASAFPGGEWKADGVADG